MQINGAWPEAIEEVRLALEVLVDTNDREATAAAFYQEAEICRLRGDHAAAEAAYRSASQWGMEPQPGLALLRLAQGRKKAAAGAIRRAAEALADPLQRARLLPACVEIMLAVGAGEEADGVCRDLEEIAARFNTEVLDAMAAHARGAVALAAGDARAALGPLGRAFTIWQQVGAPYLAARVRVSVGLACRALGDDDGAELELGAARDVFERLGANPDLARIDALVRRASSDRPHGLTPRELQVLRLVAAGETNKAIAQALNLSERTIDRHVSNIFNKLDVPTRAAATAHAYKQKLI
jgi:ATP/maltotriose-dependent transcriptional regulator MalT